MPNDILAQHDTPLYWLKRNLNEVFRLPPEAIDWLVGLWEITQLFDDIADGDEITRPTLDIVLWEVLIRMPDNAFFISNRERLTPLVATMILKWQASDHHERHGQVDAKTYMWRAGYYDLVLMCVLICHGPEIATRQASKVLDLYGEQYEDYLREFGQYA